MSKQAGVRHQSSDPNSRPGVSIRGSWDKLAAGHVVKWAHRELRSLDEASRRRARYARPKVQEASDGLKGRQRGEEEEERGPLSASSNILEDESGG